MNRNLSTLPISTSVRCSLQNSGFSTTEDLKSFSASQLKEVTQLKEGEINEVLRIISEGDGDRFEKDFGTDALTKLNKEKSLACITTSSCIFDKLLGGGIRRKMITEICGSPGSGKTQICFQLCANVQIPAICNGCNKEAIFIDTEGGFSVDRFIQIAGSTSAHCNKIVKTSINTKKLLQGLNLFQCKNCLEILAIVNTMPKFLKDHPKVSLLVLDSISFHFRYGFDGNYMLRNRLLNNLVESLAKLANDFDLAVIVTNQMTTRLNKNGSNVTPALGDSWGHAIPIRIILSHNNGKHIADLFKCPWKENDSAQFDIRECGICDIRQENSAKQQAPKEIGPSIKKQKLNETMKN